ncbi:MAG TPA: hypothetical protein VGC92_01035 [Phenylobacterium sp.]|jgi:hypothetical protein
MADETPIVVRESRLKAGLAGVGSAAFVAAGFWMLSDPKASHDVAMLCIAFFGFCGLAAVLQLVRPNTLTLDPSGFTVRTAWNRWHVAWGQASNFRLYQQRRIRLVAYDIAADASAGIFQGSFRCLPAYWSKSPPEVLALLETGKAKWG